MNLKLKLGINFVILLFKKCNTRERISITQKRRNMCDIENSSTIHPKAFTWGDQGNSEK